MFSFLHLPPCTYHLPFPGLFGSMKMTSFILSRQTSDSGGSCSEINHGEGECAVQPWRWSSILPHQSVLVKGACCKAFLSPGGNSISIIIVLTEENTEFKPSLVLSRSELWSKYLDTRFNLRYFASEMLACFVCCPGEF